MPFDYFQQPIYGRCMPFQNKVPCNYVAGSCCTPDNYCDTEHLFFNALLNFWAPFDCKCHINNQTLTDGSFGNPAYYYPYNGKEREEMAGKLNKSSVATFATAITKPCHFR